MLKKLLNHIISKHVCHQLERVRENLLKNELLVICRGNLELLLNKSTAMLITAEFNNASNDIADLKFAVLARTKLLKQLAAWYTSSRHSGTLASRRTLLRRGTTTTTTNLLFLIVLTISYRG